MKNGFLLAASFLFSASAFGSQGPLCDDILNMKSDYHYDVGASRVTINGGHVVALKEESKTSAPHITEAKIASNAGAALVELNVQLPNGHVFNLLGPGNAQTIENNFRAALAEKDPYAGNTFFKPGSAGVFGMMANRLTGKLVAPGVIEATVLGQKVRMPLNNGFGEGQIPHHLHGLLFDKHASSTITKVNGGASVETVFEPGFENGFWTGRSSIKISQRVVDGRFEFRMRTTNLGSTPVPVGSGAHPYFLAPSGDPSAVRVDIPATEMPEIDNYENVLPTGRILKIKKGSRYDFNDRHGVALKGRYFDNLFVNLIPDENGYAYAEFIDTKAKLRVRLTALTKNIIGIQLYSPKPETNPKLGVFAALELVTNLPDPRDDLWGRTPTGMKLLEPGESQDYGYKIEVFPL